MLCAHQGTGGHEVMLLAGSLLHTSGVRTGEKFLLCIVSEVHFVRVLISVQQHYGHEGSCEHGKYIPCVHVNVSSGL